jgi:hypothetical protein
MMENELPSVKKARQLSAAPAYIPDLKATLKLPAKCLGRSQGSRWCCLKTVVHSLASGSLCCPAEDCSGRILGNRFPTEIHWHYSNTACSSFL